MIYINLNTELNIQTYKIIYGTKNEEKKSIIYFILCSDLNDIIYN